MMKIQQKLKKVFERLNFKEEGHIYSYNNKILTPVSNLIGNFYEQFDTQKHATRVAKREGVATNVVVQRWADNGKKAADFGTSVHDWAEQYAYGMYFSPSYSVLKPKNKHEIAAKTYIDNLPIHITIAELELKMYSEKYGYAGTCDVLLYNNRTRKYIISDYKTTKDIFKNYNNELMYPPFMYMLDMAYNHYQLQLSLYQILLEEAGYKVEERWLVWLKPDATYTVYKTKDFRKLLKQYLNDNRRNNPKSPELVLQRS